RLGISTGHWNQTGRRVLAERTLTGTNKRTTAGTAASATVSVERGGGKQPTINTRKEVRSCAAHRIDVRIRPKRDVVRNKEYSIASANHSLGIHGIGETKSRQEFLLRKGQIVAAVVNASLDQEQVSRAGASRST